MVYAASFQVSLLSLRKELVDFSSTVSFSHQPGQNSSITLADGKKVPFFDDGKNYKLPYITHDTYMMTSKETSTEASPAGVYALRRVEEWKPEMLWHHRIGHCAIISTPSLAPPDPATLLHVVDRLELSLPFLPLSAALMLDGGHGSRPWAPCAD